MRAQANAAALRTLGQFCHNPRLARKTARACAARTPRLLNGPSQPRLDRAGGGVNVMAVKAKPRLQPQAVTRAKADRHHFGLIQKRAGQGFGKRCGHRNLEAILAGIARARDPQILALPAQHRDIHKAHRGDVGDQPRQGGLGLRALQRQKPTIRHRNHLADLRQMRCHMGDIGGFAGGIDHHKDMIATIGEHQIVQNAASFIGKQPVALPPLGQPQHINRHQRFKRQSHGLIAVFRAQDHLPHVADVKKPSRRTTVQMFLHHPSRILHRHMIARKGHHLAAQRQMQVVQSQIV